jgi:biopolymer transport protein ExbD
MSDRQICLRKGGLLAGRRRKMPEAGKLNLVSLMDIFTILVFFLMVNSSDVQVFQQNKSIDLPESLAEQVPAESLLIMITDTDVLVQGKAVASLPISAGQEDEVIPSLKQALLSQAKRVTFSQVAVADAEAAEPLPVTIMGDATVPYALLKRIMATCSETPYRDVSLAVKRLFGAGENVAG